MGGSTVAVYCYCCSDAGLKTILVIAVTIRYHDNAYMQYLPSFKSSDLEPLLYGYVTMWRSSDIESPPHTHSCTCRRLVYRDMYILASLYMVVCVMQFHAI